MTPPAAVSPVVPALVYWFFENRLAPPLSGPVADATIAWNERFWQALCVSQEAAEAMLTAPGPIVDHPGPVNTLPERPPLLREDAGRVAYMREYMRRRRAAPRGA